MYMYIHTYMHIYTQPPQPQCRGGPSTSCFPARGARRTWRAPSTTSSSTLRRSTTSWRSRQMSAPQKRRTRPARKCRV